jgi:hypothetical protein
MFSSATGFLNNVSEYDGVGLDCPGKPLFCQQSGVILVLLISILN